MIAVCRQFGWDYYTYKEQPTWFIEQIVKLLKEEAWRAKSEARRKPL